RSEQPAGGHWLRRVGNRRPHQPQPHETPNRVESGNSIMTEPRVHVCVVCSGNICRSPMAKLVLTEHLRRAGLEQQVRVSSAGIGSWHSGRPMDTRAMATLREQGYNGEHVAAQLDDQHLTADVLLAADSGHLHALREKLPDPDKARLLREFDPTAQPDAEVPDPYYGPEHGFDEVLDMIERAVPGIIAHIRELR